MVTSWAILPCCNKTPKISLIFAFLFDIILHMKIKKVIALFAIVSLTSGFQSLLAWGPEGHKIVALIAQHYLDHATLAKILKIKNGNFNHDDLKTNDNFMGRHTVDDELTAFFAATDVQLVLIPNWADGWDHNQKNADALATSVWHFVDIPIGAPPTDQVIAQLCQNHLCVIDQLEIQTDILKDSSQPIEDRMKALFFVVHFSGDIHQPLHCSNEIVNGVSDRGGNGKPVAFFSSSTIGTKKRELHALWDSYFIEKHTTNQVSYANELIADIDKNGNKATWENLDFKSWSLDSHQASLGIYDDYKSKISSGQAVPDYESADESKWLPIIDAQLEKAGVRLAYLLKTSLTGTATSGNTTTTTPTSTTPDSTPTSSQVIVTRTTAKVFKEPNSKSDLVATVKQGDVLDLDTTWTGKIYYKVTTGGQPGYISKRNAKPQ